MICHAPLNAKIISVSHAGFTLGISENAYRRLVEEIAAFRKRIKEIVSEDEGSSRVYRLNLHLFPLSEKLRNENEDK